MISFARHPLLGSEDYRPATMDPDLRLAERLAGREIDYVMLSSRKVYAPSARPLAETDPTGPQDLYGRHKLAVEDALRARLGARLTILRLANVFGYERGPARRTFLSLTLDGLAREGRIRFDMSPFVERDFLPVEACARVLARIVAAPPGGVLNVGSGIARADRPPRALGARRLWPRRAGDRIAARARRLRARRERAYPALRPALHVRRAARELHRARSPPGQRDRTALVVEIQRHAWLRRRGRISVPNPGVDVLGNLTHAFSSRLSSFRKRQSVPSASSAFGLDLIIPASWRRSA